MGAGPRGRYTSASIYLSPNTSELASKDVPAGDRIWFWDTSNNKWDLLTVGTNLAISGTTLNAANQAPIDADYLVHTANAQLTAERVVTDTATITWDWSDATKAKANVVASGDVAVLQSDFPKANNTYSNVTDLTLNLVSGHWYYITGQFIFSGDGGTGDCQLRLNGGSVTIIGGAGNATKYDTQSVTFYADQLAGISDTIAGFDGPTTVTINLTIQVDVGGTLIPKFSQVMTDAGNPSRLWKYATLTAVDITP